MKFELLPNELILDLFGYLSCIHLFQCFFGLNSRFNTLLYQRFQKFHLDFRLISKTNFNHICQNHLSSIINRSISLHLSNDEDTPQQIELFFSHNDYQLRQFIHLKSISLSHLESQETLHLIMIECSYLPYLTHLTLTGNQFEISEIGTEWLFNCIWNLPKLIYCYLDVYFGHDDYVPDPTVVSTSLRHLIIPDRIFTLYSLSWLYQHTPNLRFLSINCEDYFDHVKPPLPILSITRLKIIVYKSINIFQHLLQNTPDLHHLTWESCCIYTNGNQWEETIKKYLPKLKIFHLKMRLIILNHDDKEMQFHQIINSFRTKFWINDHQRFVRCYWYAPVHEHQPNFVDLFTLPYTFDSFSDETNCILTKSTCPYDDEYFRCDSVIDLNYGSSRFTNSILSHVRFYNIQFLSLTFPIDEQFFIVVPELDQLTSLTVSVDRNETFANIQSQLQFLLDWIPRLHSLNFDEWSSPNCQLLLVDLTSVSVRRLDLRGDISKHHSKWDYSNEKQCIQLCHSPLGIQCEKLLMHVENRRNILDLVNNMPNLQVLTIRCKDDRWINENNLIKSNDDELVEWLRQQLPLTCMISRDTYSEHENIRIWIR